MNGRIVLRSSDLAACIGRNQYKARDEMLMTYLQRYDMVAHSYFLKQGVTTTEHQILLAQNKLLFKDTELYTTIKKEVKSAVKSAVTSINYKENVTTAIESLARMIESSSNLTLQEKEVLKHDVKQQVYTKIGTRKEAQVVRRLVNANACNIYREKFMCDAYTPSGDKIEVYLCGMIDAFETQSCGKKTVVEVKNRMNRLFNYVPEYEYIQVMSYLYLTGLTAGKIVEKFQDHVAEHLVEFIDEEWTSIIKGAINFVQQLLLMCDSAWQAMNKEDEDESNDADE